MSEPTTIIDQPDFRAKAEEAARHRLAGRVDDAEQLYEEIVALGQPMAEGYGNEHIGLVHLARAERLREEGKQEEADREFETARSFYEKGRTGYEGGGDPVHVSSAMLNEAVLLQKQGRPEEAAVAIRESIVYLEEHAEEVEDRGFYDEHLQIKHVRLAGALLDADDASGAREAIETAKAIPQRNGYFVMQTEYCEGRVLAAEGKSEESRAKLETALGKAESFEDEKAIRRIKRELAELSA